jgi:hypothetical protein
VQKGWGGGGWFPPWPVCPNHEGMAKGGWARSGSAPEAGDDRPGQELISPWITGQMVHSRLRRAGSPRNRARSPRPMPSLAATGWL